MDTEEHGRAEAERRRRARVRCETRERSARHGNDQRKRRPSHMPTKYDARAQPLATDAQRTFHRTRRGGRSWSHKMARLDVSRSQPLSRIQHPRALRRGRWTRGRGRATGKRATRAALAAWRRGQRLRHTVHTHDRRCEGGAVDGRGGGGAGGGVSGRQAAERTAFDDEDGDGLRGEFPGEALEEHQGHKDREAEGVVHARRALQRGERDSDGLTSLLRRVSATQWATTVGAGCSVHVTRGSRIWGVCPSGV